MEAKAINKVFNFLIHSLIFSLISIYFITKDGYLIGTQMTLLVWSFYILCIPAKHGSILINFISRKTTGKNVAYPTIYMWLGAIVLNILSITFTPFHYLKYTTTYLLYRILATPWPHWLILLTTGIASFFPLWVSQKPSRQKKIRNLVLHKFLMILAISILIYLAITDFVVILNFQI